MVCTAWWLGQTKHARMNSSHWDSQTFMFLEWLHAPKHQWTGWPWQTWLLCLLPTSTLCNPWRYRQIVLFCLYIVVSKFTNQIEILMGTRRVIYTPCISLWCKTHREVCKVVIYTNLRTTMVPCALDIINKEFVKSVKFEVCTPFNVFFHFSNWQIQMM